MGLLTELMTASTPGELISLFRYKRHAASIQASLLKHTSSNWQYLYQSLAQVSRSFSLVIMELEPSLRHPVCIFYLVLRALDTIEDDTSIPASERSELCTSFWKLLQSNHQPNHPDKKSSQQWSSSRFGTGAEKHLLENFSIVLQCYGTLESPFRQSIMDITKRMGAGMAEHINDVSCDSIHDYDLYCHYVAGLVGIGLSQLFVHSNREHESFIQRTDLSNSMGLFLQKTNIIRDYLEDIIDGRTFWPTEIWSHYSKDLTDFKDPINRKFALACLNHMATDALRHVPDCLEYMSRVQSKDVFNFVVIPQVMAIATINEVYNNGNVFSGVVKIKRAKTAQLIMNTKSMDDVYKVFFDYATSMLRKVEPHDPNAEKTRKALNAVIDICLPYIPYGSNLLIPNILSIFLFCGLSSYVLKRRQDHFDGAVFTWRSAGGIMEPLDMLAIGALFLVCIYMYGFFLLPYMNNLQRDEVRRMQIAARARQHSINQSTPQTVTLE